MKALYITIGVVSVLAIIFIFLLRCVKIAIDEEEREMQIHRDIMED